MSELISGKEALKLVADGVVQYMHSSETQERWTTITDNFWCQYNLEMFLDSNTAFKFRLKPRTITINGIEVPKPNYFVDAPRDYDGRGEINIGGTYLLYKSRKDHDAVVAALRSVFGKK